ncbi:type II secretion system protein [Photobacterium damselae]|uniref:type II secretion system protein n=1 Tax=Photobacterium damselae TaxID=38293 RepID=UPI000D660C0B|nr:type II secretion system protein [Photobacterium damselae]AWK80907.1 MSHA biogenesis protein MshA [Photobacterium damselae]
MKRQGGFTLIELVVVIVILGILAVTAAPKFMNLQTDARNASLQGLKGAIQGAAGIVYGKAAIKGIEATAASNNVGVSGADGTLLTTAYGYPTANSKGIQKAVSGLDNSKEWKAVSAANAVVPYSAYTFANQQVPTGGMTNCYVLYKQATSVSSAASAEVVDCK